MIEIQNEQGEWVPWDYADESDKIAVEWAIMNGDRGINAYVPDTIEGLG